MNSPALFGFVGDLLVDRDQPAQPFGPVRSLLSAPDVLFGNLEGTYSDNPQPAPSGGTPLYPKAHNLAVFAEVGFDVLSLANNHIVDAGHAALLDNYERLRAQGVLTCGAGANIKLAREPAIVEAKGITVAFLAYASVFPNGYEARSNVPGLAPLRAYDFWRPAFDNYHMPGTPPLTQSVHDERDLAALREDIAAARKRADLVVASFHWGDFLKPLHLTDHERKTAHLCIDEGVDLVVGHHHHALRGMEWYRGKPIFYGLGHFVFDVRLEMSAEAVAILERMTTVQDPVTNYGIFPRPGWPLLPLHEDTRMTLLAYARATRSGFGDIGFVPCRLRPDGSIDAVDPESAEGREVVAYVERCNATQGLKVALAADEGTIGGHSGVRVLPAS